MKKQILCTTITLLTAALAVPLSCNAELTKADNPSSRDKQANSSETIPATQAANVVKVGEYQSSGVTRAAEAIVARIQPHKQAGNQAVTLYVRDIPVLTFVGSNSTTTSDPKKIGSTRDSKSEAAETQTQVASVAKKLPSLSNQASGTNNLQTADAPLWRATAVAAKLNQLNLDNVDAKKITVSWKGGNKSDAKETSEHYSIQVNDVELVAIDASTRLPDRTKNLAEDALQVTNRLRRLLGDAPPLKEVAGMPKPPQPKPSENIAFGPVRFSLRGMASWYGPGFHGNRTANGETYNQHALTAAHRSLPFGTRVRVTHTRTGRSVVVRINDRGPYIGGRVLDLSAGAARVLGMMGSGVAPVRVEVLN